jgi:hypothetical protein
LLSPVRFLAAQVNASLRIRFRSFDPDLEPVFQKAFLQRFAAFVAPSGLTAFADMGSLEDQFIFPAKRLGTLLERILGVAIQDVGTTLLRPLRIAFPSVDLERQSVDPSFPKAVKSEGVAGSADEWVEMPALDDDRP